MNPEVVQALPRSLRSVWAEGHEGGVDGARVGARDDAAGAVPSPAGHSLHSRPRLLVAGDAARDRILGAADAAAGGRDASDGSPACDVRSCSPSGVRGRACAAVGVEAVGGFGHVRNGEVRLSEPTAVYLRWWSPDVDDCSGVQRATALLVDLGVSKDGRTAKGLCSVAAFGLLPIPRDLEMSRTLPVARPGWHAFFWLSLSHNWAFGR